MPTPAPAPFERIVRTMVQVTAAMVVIVPAALAILGSVGVDTTAPWAVAVTGLAVVLSTTVQNAYEAYKKLP